MILAPYIRSTGILFLVAFVVGHSFCAYSAEDASEPQADNIKAAFIYKITGYITWPETDTKNFTVAVLGKTSFVEPLREIAGKRKVGDKQLVIRECATIEETVGAQVLLISPAMEKYLEAILKKAHAGKMLTVASAPGFAEKGVAINLIILENRVGLEINLGSLKKSGLPVSSHLVKLAKLVGDTEQEEKEGQPE